MKIRDRVKELRRVRAGELRPHPKNWRTHPAAQRDALRGVLAEIGYADALLARELPDGTLELAGHGWGENIAEIRLIIASSFQRTGLGTVLARELHLLAAEHKVDRIVARLMRPQVGAHRILHNLGFHEEFLIPEMVKDRSGQWQDMIIMRCNLDNLWREMETMFELSDWQRHR